jgi:hypothetical protein
MQYSAFLCLFYVFLFDLCDLHQLFSYRSKPVLIWAINWLSEVISGHTTQALLGIRYSAMPPACISIFFSSQAISQPCTITFYFYPYFLTSGKRFGTITHMLFPIPSQTLLRQGSFLGKSSVIMVALDHYQANKKKRQHPRYLKTGSLLIQIRMLVSM